MTKDFRPLVIGGLYAGIDRGLVADTLAVRALDGKSYTTCTSIIVASSGTVSEIIDVPTDTVDAQLQHIFKHESSTASKIGIVGNSATAEVIFQRLKQYSKGPCILDITLSGPSGEDLAGRGTVNVILDNLAFPDLISVRKTDAERLANMEITSLDDAQVAIQRIASLGASCILLRCGRLVNRYFDTQQEPQNLMFDLLYYDQELSLFEAPFIENLEPDGSSSVLLIPLLYQLSLKKSVVDALQFAKAYVTEALRAAQKQGGLHAPDYFWQLRNSVHREN